MRLHGHEIALHEHGPEDGPVVLFLHSSGMSSRQWRYYAHELADRGWRALAPDFIGCGDSQPWRGEGPFHFHADLRAMDELIRRRDAPVHLVGHSYGGFLAIQLATTLGSRVASVAVWEPVAWGVLYASGPEGEAFHRDQVERGFFDEAIGGTEPWMKSFVEWWSGEGAWEAIGERGRGQMMRSARKTFEEVRSLGEEHTPALHYATIEAPTLLMNGTRSPPQAREACELLASVISDVERRQLDAGHLAPMSDAGLVAPLVFEWLERQS